jgi:hypothetical protein
VRGRCHGSGGSTDSVERSPLHWRHAHAWRVRKSQFRPPGQRSNANTRQDHEDTSARRRS